MKSFTQEAFHNEENSFGGINIIVMSSSGSFAEDSYDPQHTMLALNMAIVSVNRILSTQDRIVLEWEYENIINRLAIGNIEGDSALVKLYDELLGFINGKRLRQEDMKMIREGYRRREQEAFYRAMSKGFENLKAPENDNLWGWRFENLKAPENDNLWGWRFENLKASENDNL